MNILVTGGTGFLGRSLIGQLSPHCVSVLGRHQLESNESAHHYGVIDNKSSYIQALINKEVLIHCAARVHIMDDNSSNPLEAFREVNTHGTLNLAKQAADAGVKRFIFISSIKVNGESTELGLPFKPDDVFTPEDPYGLSKYEAEIGLRKIAEETGMEVVIIRPPLVYGPGVKANFAALMKLSSFGLPLPLGGITDNLRSMVFVENLVDLIVTCLDHHNAANKVFLVSDDEDISTTGMLKLFSQSFGKSGFMIPMPASWFELLGKVTGKNSVIERLCGSLQVDITDTKNSLNWKPPISINDGFLRTVQHFQQQK